MNALFLPGVDPSGRVIKPAVGRLSCPHCGELHKNPKDGFFNTWTLAQIGSLAARAASLMCAQCGDPSTVSMSDAALVMKMFDEISRSRREEETKKDDIDDTDSTK